MSWMKHSVQIIVIIHIIKITLFHQLLLKVLIELLFRYLHRGPIAFRLYVVSGRLLHYRLTGGDAPVVGLPGQELNW